MLSQAAHNSRELCPFDAGPAARQQVTFSPRPGQKGLKLTLHLSEHQTHDRESTSRARQPSLELHGLSRRRRTVAPCWKIRDCSRSAAALQSITGCFAGSVPCHKVAKTISLPTLRSHPVDFCLKVGCWAKSYDVTRQCCAM